MLELARRDAAAPSSWRRRLALGRMRGYRLFTTIETGEDVLKFPATSGLSISAVQNVVTIKHDQHEPRPVNIRVGEGRPLSLPCCVLSG